MDNSVWCRQFRRLRKHHSHSESSLFEARFQVCQIKYQVSVRYRVILDTWDLIWQVQVKSQVCPIKSQVSGISQVWSHSRQVQVKSLVCQIKSQVSGVSQVSSHSRHLRPDLTSPSQMSSLSDRVSSVTYRVIQDKSKSNLNSVRLSLKYQVSIGY